MIGRNAAITDANSAYAHSPITGFAFFTDATTSAYLETAAGPSRGMSRAGQEKRGRVTAGWQLRSRAIDGFGTTLYVATLDTVNIIVRMRPW